MQLKLWRWMAGVGFVVLVLLAGCQASSTDPATLSKATNGSIHITLDRTAYSVEDPVGVTVSNISKDTYYAIDGKSACTFLELQKYDSSKKTWSMVDVCTIAQPVSVLQVPAGITEPFSLAPGSPSNENSWQTGIYRVAMVYSANTDGKTDAQTAYSAAFAINS